MLIQPTQFLGQPLPRLRAALAECVSSLHESSDSGRIEPFWTDTVAESVLCRPALLLSSTLPDADLSEDHPPIDVPGVILETYLGGGGQGWVYAGRVQATGRVVAVKVLRADRESGENRAEREALGARVRHRNVLRVFRVEPAGRYWLVIMELIQGADLQSARPGDRAFADCFRQLAAGLCALARQRIVHCDVKPTNVLLRARDRSPVLVDFGLAWDLDSARVDYGLFGTPYYLPPEAFGTPGRPDPSWDAYALGVTAAVVLLGKTFPGTTLTDLLTAKVSGAFDGHLRAELAEVGDARLREWITRLTDREPTRRTDALAVANRFLEPHAA